MGIRWRIRHKLALGLALVVGIMVLLMVGTLSGLLSYRTTMKSMDSKLQELKAARQLDDSIQRLAALVEGPGTAANPRDLLDRIDTATDALAVYRQRLCDTLVHHRDLDDGYDEMPLVRDLADDLARLREKIRTVQNGPAEMVFDPAGGDDPVTADLRRDIEQLQLAVTTLQEHINTDLNRRISRSKEHYRISLGLVIATGVLGGLCMLGLGRLAYRWIVEPIRDLHAKVGRLAQGDFDSHIEVSSTDEMQDLAAAFNHMIDRLRAIYTDLARQVNERSRQLVRSERLAGVGFLAAGVAHEINNPLASVAFCSEALERRLRDVLADRADDPEVATIHNYLTMIQQEAFRCKDITQRLLEFSRIGERQRQWVNLADLIQSVLDMVLHLQSYKGKHIVFQPRHRPRVLVNAPEIKSVVLNLVVNALDSMDPGGTLTIGIDVEPGMAVVTFTDTGCGMTPEVLENLFEPFFTRNRTGSGIGLGLSISHRIINQHGGEIEATSPGPNQGSTFTVRLPRAADGPNRNDVPKAA